MKYFIIRNFLTEYQCDKVITSFYKDQAQFDLDLFKDDDKGNVIYHSTRSNNLSYKYIKDNTSQFISWYAKKKLKSILNVDFNGSINDKCLPVFCYGENGEIKAHRGVQKEQNSNKYQSYVAVCQLTQRGVDFEGGEFYVNTKANYSNNGKYVSGDNKEDRFYPMLNKGDVCLIHNPSLVHGVETVRKVDSIDRCVRMTCSWRSNQEQL